MSAPFAPTMAQLASTPGYQFTLDQGLKATQNAYAAQGLAGSFIVKIVGSYTNVVGLPLYETASLLSGEGYPIHFGWLNAV